VEFALGALLLAGGAGEVGIAFGIGEETTAEEAGAGKELFRMAGRYGRHEAKHLIAIGGYAHGATGVALVKIAQKGC
jgi:hypothetical protein